jgi:hypothetical protein
MAESSPRSVIRPHGEFPTGGADRLRMKPWRPGPPGFVVGGARPSKRSGDAPQDEVEEAVVATRLRLTRRARGRGINSPGRLNH